MPPETPSRPTPDREIPRPTTSSASNGFEVPENCPWTIVLGIDPGTQVVGYGAVVPKGAKIAMLAAGVMRAPARQSPPIRLGLILEQFEQLLARLKPNVVVVERAFVKDNTMTALRIGEGRGMILAAASRFGAEVIELTPAEAKKTITGNGQAEKEQVAELVAAELGLSEVPQPLDATDALALAVTHVHRARVRSMLVEPDPPNVTPRTA